MKLRVILGILLALLLTAGFTNPTRDQYLSWSKEQLIEQSGNGFVGFITSMVGPTLIDGNTKRDSYVIFSIYHTKIANDELTVLGAFNNFVPINKDKIEPTK